MRPITQLIESRKLSGEQAMRIAVSQTDLGGKSQQDMILALAGFSGKITSVEEWHKTREEAYERLDPISKMIVAQVLNGDLSEAEDNLSYCANCFKAAHHAVARINSEVIIDEEA